MNEQTSIFEFLYPTYKIDKPVRLIELFAGYGSQHLAMKYIGVDVESWKIAEWNYKSFHAYKELHMDNDKKDYSEGKTKDELAEYLSKKNISSNWNEPMTYEQIKRLNEQKIREIYNDIQATHNLVNISQVKASDLHIVDTDQYVYILTYSFPCQDLSLAGLRAGMDRNSGSRSSLLWQVERILTECKELGCLPQVLLMENVIQVHGTENEENWREWLLHLEKLGYTNYWQDMIATDYGIPQIRNRTFCISLLGEYNYSFPKPIQLEKRLKDLLEKNVNEKYYLSKRAVQGIANTDFAQAKLKNRTENPDGCMPSLLSRDYKDPKLVVVKLDKSSTRAEKVSSTIVASGDGTKVALQEPRVMVGTYDYTKSEQFLHNKPRANIGAKTINTLLTEPKVGIIEVNSFIKENNKAELLFNIYGTKYGTGFAGNVWNKEKMSPTLQTMSGGNRQPLIDDGETVENMRIRKLTPRECFRLQGVKDEDFDKLKDLSESTLYHLAGDSICCSVLMAIFGKLCGIEWENKIRTLNGNNSVRGL